MRQIFEHYASGNYTLAQLVKLAREWGLRNVRGKQKGINATHMLKILQDPFYYGVMRVKKNGAEYPHRYQPVIDKQLFDQCQEVRLGRSHKTSYFRGKDYAFRGILTCAVTGRLVTAETHKKKYKNGGTGEWTYLATYNPEDPTKKIWVREEEVLEQVEAIFARMAVHEKLLDNILKYIRKTNEEKKLFHNRQLAVLKKEHIDIGDRIDKLVDLLMDKAIDREEFEAKKKRLKDRQYEINALVQSFDEADDQFNNKLADLIELAAGAPNNFAGSGTTRKRELMNFVFQNLKLNGKKLEYSMRSPFKEFADCQNLQDWWGGEGLEPPTKAL